MTEIARIIFILTLPLFFMAKDNIIIGTYLYLFHTLIYLIWFLPAHSESIPIAAGLSLPYYLILSILFFILGIVRFFLRNKHTILDKSFRNFLIAFLVSLILSIQEFGTKAIHDAGGIIILLFPTLYFSLFKYDEATLKKIYKIFSIYIILLFPVSWLRYISILPINPYYQEIIDSGYASFYKLRLLSAAQGMDLLMCFFIIVLLVFNRCLKKKILILSFSSLFLAIIIQQRVIYIMVIVCFILMSLFIKKIKLKLIFTVMSFLIASGIFLIISNKFFKALFYQSIFEQGISDIERNTFTARLFQARYLIMLQLKNIFSTIFGYHFGASQSSMIFNRWVDFSIHIFHYQIIYQAGLFLFFFHFYYHYKLLKFSYRTPIFDHLFLGKILFTSILLNILLCFTTSPSHISPIVYGITTSLMASKKTSDNLQYNTKNKKPIL
jgi:hypothetical protein